MKLNYFTCTLGQAALLEQAKPYRSIPEFIDYQAQHHPNVPAVGTYRVNDDGPWTATILTFLQVQRGVRAVAQRLQSELEDNDRRTVALLAASSLDFLFAWLALMYLGNPVLLIAPQCSPSAVAALCEACEIEVLFCESQYRKLAEKASQYGTGRIVNIRDSPTGQQELFHDDHDGSGDTQLKHADVQENDVAYLHHTSGTSSGVPKPIPQTHRGGLGVLPRLDGSATSTFTTTPLYHGGIADLFRSWTSNALIWLFPGRDAPITASNILQCLDISASNALEGGSPRIAYFSSVPYVLQMLAEDANGLRHLQNMDLVGVGGAALSGDAGDALVESGVKLVSRFGSAECGFLLSSDRAFDQDKGWQYLRPDTRVKALSFEPCEDGLSELVVRSGWPHMAKTNRRDGSFATSDLFEPHPSISNAWRYHSRADSQLTLITGKKFDPAPLEAAIVSSSNSISDAMIFGEGEAYPGVLLFRAPDKASVSDEDLIDHLRPAIEKLNGEAQSHAQIPADMLLPMPPTELEKSSKGTLIRSAITKRFAPNIEKMYRGHLETNGAAHIVNDAEITNVILKDVRDLLPSATGLTEGSDLFAFGVDSVASMRIRNRLCRLVPGNVKLPLSIVQDCGTVRKLSKVLMSLRLGDNVAEPSASDTLTVMKGLVEEYTTLRETKSALSRPTHGPASRLPGGSDGLNTILLTGSTGSLGAHLLSQLLERNAELCIGHIYILARSSKDVDALGRVKKALISRCLHCPSEHTFPTLATVLDGDISANILGLDSSTYDLLSASVTHVYHLAWAVNFLLPLSAYRPHFAGLQNLLHLAVQSHHLQRFVFCSSTASVSSYNQKSSIPEQIISDPTAAGATGYARSKWVGEAICATYVDRLDHRHDWSLSGKVYVTRVGQLSGSSKTGVWNGNEAYPLMLSASRALGIVPDLDAVRQEQGKGIEECAWVPLNVAAAAFVQLGQLGKVQPAIRSIEAGGQQCSKQAQQAASAVNVYHLLPQPGMHSSWTDVVEAVLAADPGVFRVVSMAKWLDKLESISPESQHDKGGDNPVDISPSHPASRLVGFWREAYLSKNNLNRGRKPSGTTVQSSLTNKPAERDSVATSGFNMERSLKSIPVLRDEWPAALHTSPEYVAACWNWIKENV